MKLVVGLGNPGRKYQVTRHNVGFEVLAAMARKYAAGPVRSKFEGEVSEVIQGDCRALLLCPLTYMNRSGLSVCAAYDFYKLELPQLLVVCDDFNLPLGKLRFRPSGSAGGQKGLADIIQRLGSDQFARLRIGIGAARRVGSGRPCAEPVSRRRTRDHRSDHPAGRPRGQRLDDAGC